MKSAFGRKFDELSRQRGLKYSCVARGAKVSPTLISLVVSGEKSPTKKLVDACIEVFELTEAEASELEYAAEISQKQYVIRPQNEKQAELIVAFTQTLGGENVDF